MASKLSFHSILHLALPMLNGASNPASREPRPLPLGPSDAIWRHRFGSTLAQVMACCLMAPSHYLNQCWVIINEVPWFSSESNFTESAHTTILYLGFENQTFRITAISPRGQWVNTIEAEMKWPPFSRSHFQMHFPEPLLSFVVVFKLYWSLFLRVHSVISHHWFR